MWWRWYHWANPVAWTLYGLVVSQYGDITDELEDLHIPVRRFLKSYFGFRHDFTGIVATVVVGFGLVFGFMFAFSIRAFNFQRR